MEILQERNEKYYVRDDNGLEYWISKADYIKPVEDEPDKVEATPKNVARTSRNRKPKSTLN